MRVGLPLLIAAALSASTVVAAPPATAQASSAQTPALVLVKHKNKKNAHGLGHLRVVITGSPKGRVHLKGPRTHLAITQSSVLAVPSGRYRLHAANVRLDGDNYLPTNRKWTFTVRKGATTMVDVSYTQSGSSAPGSVDTSVPPPGMLGETFTLINQARSQARQCGDEAMPAVDPVVYDDQLGRAAQGHAEDMNSNNYFEHDSLDGRTFSDRIEAAKYEGLPAGENIAMGFQNASDVVTGWLNSPGHCKNIMDPEFDEMGLGFASHVDARYAVPVTYWVQDFGYAPDYM